MAICGNCGHDTPRVRSKWKEGIQLPDECPHCSPDSFEAIKSVRDGQISMGWEYMPTMYKKTDAGYVPKDELLADTEAQVCKKSDEDIAAEQAIEDKRRTRRTMPLSPSEIEILLNRINNESRESKAAN